MFNSVCQNVECTCNCPVCKQHCACNRNYNVRHKTGCYQQCYCKVHHGEWKTNISSDHNGYSSNKQTINREHVKDKRDGQTYRRRCFKCKKLCSPTAKKSRNTLFASQSYRKRPNDKNKGINYQKCFDEVICRVPDYYLNEKSSQWNEGIRCKLESIIHCMRKRNSGPSAYKSNGLVFIPKHYSTHFDDDNIELKSCNGLKGHILCTAVNKQTDKTINKKHFKCIVGTPCNSNLILYANQVKHQPQSQRCHDKLIRRPVSISQACNCIRHLDRCHQRLQKKSFWQYMDHDSCDTNYGVTFGRNCCESCFTCCKCLKLDLWKRLEEEKDSRDSKIKNNTENTKRGDRRLGLSRKISDLCAEKYDQFCNKIMRCISTQMTSILPRDEKKDGCNCCCNRVQNKKKKKDVNNDHNCNKSSDSSNSSSNGCHCQCNKENTETSLKHKPVADKNVGTKSSDSNINNEMKDIKTTSQSIQIKCENCIIDYGGKKKSNKSKLKITRSKFYSSSSSDSNDNEESNVNEIPEVLNDIIYNLEQQNIRPLCCVETEYNCYNLQIKNQQLYVSRDSRPNILENECSCQGEFVDEEGFIVPNLPELCSLTNRGSKMILENRVIECTVKSSTSIS